MFISYDYSAWTLFMFRSKNTHKNMRNIWRLEIDHRVTMLIFLETLRGTKCIFAQYSFPLIRLLSFSFWRCSPKRAMTSSFMTFLDYTQQRTTVSRTPLDEWSARRRDLYLTTHNIHNRKTSMPSVGIKSTISAGERPQIYTLDRVATGTGLIRLLNLRFLLRYINF